MKNEIIGTIKQSGTSLFTDHRAIAYQYAENLKLSIVFTDAYFEGYSCLWLYAHDLEMQKSGALLYDEKTQMLTLPPAVFDKGGRLYIQMFALKGNVKIPTSCVEFYIHQSIHTNADNTPKEPGWEEIAKNLMQQIFEHEYKEVTDKLINNVQDVVDDITKKLANGTFQGAQGIQGATGAQGMPGTPGSTGAQGPQGIQGPTGVKGDKGDRGNDGINGVITPTNGMFAFTGDSEGNLYCNYTDMVNPPSFEVDTGDNIYMILPE